jgi:hypothetical protein
MGVPSLGGPLTTAGGVAFLTSTSDCYIRAYDVRDGTLLWQDRLPAGGQSMPMSYAIDGRQYVVTAAGGHGSFRHQAGRLHHRLCTGPVERRRRRTSTNPPRSWPSHWCSPGLRVCPHGNPGGSILFMRTRCAEDSTMKTMTIFLSSMLIAVAAPAASQAAPPAGHCASLSGSARLECEQTLPFDQGNRPGEKAQSDVSGTPGADTGGSVAAGQPDSNADTGNAGTANRSAQSADNSGSNTNTGNSGGSGTANSSAQSADNSGSSDSGGSDESGSSSTRSHDESGRTSDSSKGANCPGK